jgi:hypothetical protein
MEKSSRIVLYWNEPDNTRKSNSPRTPSGKIKDFHLGIAHRKELKGLFELPTLFCGQAQKGNKVAAQGGAFSPFGCADPYPFSTRFE